MSDVDDAFSKLAQKSAALREVLQRGELPGPAPSTALPPVNALVLVRDALAHLQCAERQMLPSDDQIISEHIRVAIALLKPVADPLTRVIR